ncbi:methyltransferase-like protein 24 [Oryzias melastigma]|uniref:Methyltransferase like 24 n=1 Tax=Oryzias melastigma TaxID=30732 RepID=A0A3B3BQH3_ORYME|nr:methyltransferase-like protein 24 [Oryzias melastigma]
MSRGRLTPGLLLRLGILFMFVCLCIYVYLETGWKASPASLDSGTQFPPNWGQLRIKLASAEEEESWEISYIHTQDSEPTLHKKAPRWRIDLQPWAGPKPSLEDEAKRFLSYITTPQVSCASLSSKRTAWKGSSKGWAVCLDPKYSLIQKTKSKSCRVYSFGLGVTDWWLERFLGRSGCQVHCFDPSLKQLHQQDAEMWLHRLSVDWRDPNPAIAQHQHANSKKLATILNDFGHREVDVLKVDMESAEWKILENLVLEGVLDSVGQLLLEIHLHWAGFEVGGDDPSVVRYWFSLLKELEDAGFNLFYAHRNPSKPPLFLQKNLLNASSAYTLGWVKWKPSMVPDEPKSE